MARLLLYCRTVFRQLKSALVTVALVTSVSAPFADASVQSLQAQLDQVVQGWQTGWVADPLISVGGPDPRPQLFRWRRNGALITIEVRDFPDGPAALADVDATPRLVSMGTVAAERIGDRAYVASVPGGYTTVSVAVGSRVFTLNFRDAPDVVKSLAVRLVPVIKAYPAGSKDPVYD
jgi:hypothetical protein